MPVTHTDLLPATTVIVHGLKAMFYVLWTSLSVLFFLVVKSTHILLLCSNPDSHQISPFN